MVVVMLQKTAEPITNTVCTEEAESWGISDGTDANDGVGGICVSSKSVVVELELSFAVQIREQSWGLSNVIT